MRLPAAIVVFLAVSAPRSLPGQAIRPVINAVAHAASYSNGPISPGQMIVIFGTGMGPSHVVSAQLDPQGQIATQLSQVQVLFDGKPAPLIYASSTQISAMVPYGVAGRSSTQVQVLYQDKPSEPFSKAISAAMPGVFSANSTGEGQAAMTNADGSLNSRSNPAPPGTHVTFYVTGGGQTEPPGADGTIAGTAAAMKAPVVVRIAGRTAQVLYAGASPGNVTGFAQVNAMIPADLPYGGNLPLVVQVGEVSSQTGVTLAVSGPSAPVPEAPLSLAASSNSAGQPVVTWEPADSLAMRFHVERQASGGAFALVATVPSTTTTFVDRTVLVGTSYTYRMRAEGQYGFSPYSTPVRFVGPPNSAPAAPTLRATVTSASQVRLSWTSAAAGAVRFRIERRTLSGAYAEMGLPSATATTLDDVGLNPETTYFYRMRVETAVGISPYSNETVVVTYALPPAAPTNLRSVATSSTQVTLTWINTALGATVVHIESRTAGSAAFFDIGAAQSPTQAVITNLQPNTAYSFRVRAQNSAGYSPYSNVVTLTTLRPPKTVYLIHGLGQDKSYMLGLLNSLTGPLGLDRSRFIVNADFDFSECAATDFCSESCSITLGAHKLAQHILDTKPPGDVVLIGFSMGGLIARDMIAGNWSGVLTGRKVAALVTLGTPNIGYPYTLTDRALFCTPLLLQMDGNYRSQQAQNTVVTSEYLFGLNARWASIGYPGAIGAWLAASGRSCANPYRTINPTTGCRDASPYSDGVVCSDSASYNLNTTSGARPTHTWQDPSRKYVHSSGGLGGAGSTFILCGNAGGINNLPLSDPPPGSLLSTITGVINGLP